MRAILLNITEELKYSTLTFIAVDNIKICD